MNTGTTGQELERITNFYTGAEENPTAAQSAPTPRAADVVLGGAGDGGGGNADGGGSSYGNLDGQPINNNGPPTTEQLMDPNALAQSLGWNPHSREAHSRAGGCLRGGRPGSGVAIHGNRPAFEILPDPDGPPLPLDEIPASPGDSVTPEEDNPDGTERDDHAAYRRRRSSERNDHAAHGR